MVAASSPRLDYVPEPNFARGFLFRAADALAAGNLLQAGVLLRESIRRQLWAECAWKGCLPSDATDKTPPIVLLKAQRAAGHVTDDAYEWTKEIIGTGNRAAHCKRVDRNELIGGIAIWHTAIDNDPCNEPANMAGPKPGECFVPDDDDDDDGANWWKPQGWTFGEGGVD